MRKQPANRATTTTATTIHTKGSTPPLSSLLLLLLLVFGWGRKFPLLPVLPFVSIRIVQTGHNQVGLYHFARRTIAIVVTHNEIRRVRGRRRGVGPEIGQLDQTQGSRVVVVQAKQAARHQLPWQGKIGKIIENGIERWSARVAVAHVQEFGYRTSTYSTGLLLLHIRIILLVHTTKRAHGELLQDGRCGNGATCTTSLRDADCAT